jgi:predicted ATP-grasp superfamily ATP-dependent carboligase
MIHLKKSPKEPIEVLLTDGHSRAGLAVARSLACHNISFIVLTGKKNCLAFYSSYVKYLLLAPSPENEPQAFLEYVLKVIQRYKIQLVIPVADRSILFFNIHRKNFEDKTKIAMANSGAIRNVLDKRLNLQLAKQLGIPCPQQFDFKSSSQIPEMINTLGFPIVIKNPGASKDSTNRPFSFKVLYAGNEDELRYYIGKHCHEEVYPLFQENVGGTIHNLCCFAIQGKIIALHEYISIRRHEGQGVLRKIIKPTPILVKNVDKLLNALKWDGVAHIGFFVSNDESAHWYMETNGRFWASTEGSIQAGWDFPYWVYNYFLHKKEPKPLGIEIDSQTCWHAGDFQALISYLINRGESPTTGTNPHKLKAIAQYLSGFFPRIHSDIFRWEDPLPAIIEHLQLFSLFFLLFRKNSEL